jgi:hypothetical protein
MRGRRSPLVEKEKTFTTTPVQNSFFRGKVQVAFRSEARNARYRRVALARSP